MVDCCYSSSQKAMLYLSMGCKHGFPFPLPPHLLPIRNALQDVLVVDEWTS